MIERFKGALLGLAVGDAVGTTVEFSKRGSFEPVTDMVGGGPFNLKPGVPQSRGLISAMNLCVSSL
jgi:ADP-ribosyl-[dinitrogen reductase] hydrolase